MTKYVIRYGSRNEGKQLAIATIVLKAGKNGRPWPHGIINKSGEESIDDLLQ